MVFSIKRKTVFGAILLLVIVTLSAIVIVKNNSTNQTTSANSIVTNNDVFQTDTSIPQTTDSESSKGEQTTKNKDNSQYQTVQNAYELAKTRGYSGNIDDWITEKTIEKQDDNGKSVYNIALDNGFIGTEKEWIDFLKSNKNEKENTPIKNVNITDNGHIVIKLEDDVTIETDDVITPVEPKETIFTVTFVDRDSSVLKIQEVIKGGFASPPSMDDLEFLGWQGNYIDVQHDETVKAVYKDSKNVFQISSTQGKQGDTVSLLVSLNGSVELCGLDMNILYDSSLELLSVNDEMDMDVVVNANESQNSIRFNFSSAMNKKRSMDIMELTFRIKDSTENACTVQMSANAVKSLNDNRVEDTNFTIINGVVYS